MDHSAEPIELLVINCLDPAAIVVVWCWCEDHLLLVGVGGTSSNAYLELVLKKLANVLRPLLVAILMGIYGFTSSISITEGSSLLNGVALISAITRFACELYIQVFAN